MIYNVNNPYIRFIESWTRFIDDVLVVWSGTGEQFEDFLIYINNNEINMAFTGTFGGVCVQFLDVQIEIQHDRIVTKGFRKETATNLLLHHNSYHPVHVKRLLPYGQFLRLRRINREYDVFLEQELELNA